MELEISWNYSLFLFFATLFVYNLHALPVGKYKPMFEKRWFVIIVAFTGSVIFLQSLTLNLIFLIIPAVFLTMAYVLPLLPGKRKLRDLNWIKIFLLAGIISYVTTYIPFTDAGVDSFVKWITFLSRALFILILGFMFDIKDISKDKTNFLKSIPVVFGFKRTKVVSYILLLTIVTIDFFSVYNFIIDLNIFVSLLLTYILLLLLISTTKASSQSGIFSFLADGIIALPYLFLKLMF